MTEHRYWIVWAMVGLVSGCGDSQYNNSSTTESELFLRASTNQQTCIKYAEKIMGQMGQKVETNLFSSAAAKQLQQQFVDYLEDGFAIPAQLNTGECVAGSVAQDRCERAIGYTSSGSFANIVKTTACPNLKLGSCDIRSGQTKHPIHVAKALYDDCISLCARETQKANGSAICPAQ